MIKLLEATQNNKYQKVIIIALDRLSINESDEAQITEIFKANNVEIITPNKTYNLNKENDILMSDFEKLIARQEFGLIKKRLRQSKEEGAKQGRFVNGPAPIPYDYDNNTKQLTINENKLKIYRIIIDSLINGMTCSNVAWKLNSMSIKSVKGGIWHLEVIRRIVLDTTQLGKINFKDIVVDGLHEPVKTLEEHEQIILFLNRKTITPKRKTTNLYLLSNLIKCSKYGHTMNDYIRKEKNNEKYLKPYLVTDEVDKKCGNKSIKVRIIKL